MIHTGWIILICVQNGEDKKVKRYKQDKSSAMGWATSYNSFQSVLAKCKLEEVYQVNRTIDLFSETNKPVVEISTGSVTDDNLDQIELEMATKLILFERKLSKHKITLKVISDDSDMKFKYIEFETELQKARQTNDWDSFERKFFPKFFVGFFTDIYQFDLQIYSKCTVDELAAAIVEVC